MSRNQRTMISINIPMLILILILIQKCSGQTFAQRIHFDDDAKHFHATFWPTYIGMRLLDKHFEKKIIKPKHYKLKIYLIPAATMLVVAGGKEVVWDMWLGKGVPSLGDFAFGSHGVLTGEIVGTCDIDFRRNRREEKLNRLKNIFDE